VQERGGGVTLQVVQQPTALFTNTPEFNHYTILGCGFGAQPGLAFLSGPFQGTHRASHLQVEFWSDTAIIATLEPISEPDHRGNITLVIQPKDYPRTPVIQAPGFSFYDARIETVLLHYPERWISLGYIQYAGFDEVPTYLIQPDAQSFVKSVGVLRTANLPFGSTQDTFDFSGLSPGFYVDRYQPYTDDSTFRSECRSDDPSVQARITVDRAGAWSFVWDPKSFALRVTTQEEHCSANTQNPQQDDISYSSYGIVVWVVGPESSSPWPNNGQ
jgi:hypothetical protein